MATEQDFRDARDFTLSQEGGWYAGNKPSDPNPTLQGVTQDAYDRYCEKHRLPRQPVKKMPPSERDEIYKDYWDDGHCGELPGTLAGVHFDATFNMGPRQAALLLQRALRVRVDGVIGPKTLVAALHWAEPIACTALIGQRLRFYNDLAAKRPDLKPNLKGWTNRCTALETWYEHRLAGIDGASGSEVAETDE